MVTDTGNKAYSCRRYQFYIRVKFAFYRALFPSTNVVHSISCVASETCGLTLNMTASQLPNTKTMITLSVDCVTHVHLDTTDPQLLDVKNLVRD